MVADMLLIRDENPEGVPFEEAMSRTGFGKFNWLAVLYCGFMLLGMILETLGFSYILPSCQCDLELTLTQKGWLATIPFICIIITSHMWGYLADTRGRKKILFLCMTIGSFFSILSSFSPNLATFAVLRFIAGFFIAGPSPLGYAYLGELIPIKQRATMITLGNASVAFGLAVVPMIAWAVLPIDFHFPLAFLGIDYRPWRLMVCIFALPYLVCAAFTQSFPESPKFLMSIGRTDEALDALRHMFSLNTGKSPEEFPVMKLKSEYSNDSGIKKSFCKDIWDQTIPLFKAPYLKYTVIACSLQFAIFIIANGMTLWFPAMLNKLLAQMDAGVENQNMCAVLSLYDNNVKINDSSSAPMLACDDSLHTGTFSISILIGSVLSALTAGAAYAINVMEKRDLMMVIFFVVGCLSSSIHWITHMFSSISALAGLQIIGVCIGLTNVYVVQIFPTNIRAMAVCLSLMVGRIGSVVGTNVLGYLIVKMCPVTFTSLTALSLGAFFLCLTLPTSRNTLRR